MHCAPVNANNSCFSAFIHRFRDENLAPVFEDFLAHFLRNRVEYISCDTNRRETNLLSVIFSSVPTRNSRVVLAV